MDKYEFNIKVEQIKKMVSRGDYETAMKIADTIDWRRVRNVNILSMVATIYEKNEEYQEAKDILLLAFERAPIGKRLLFKLAELAIKEGSFQEAEDYYREFCDLAPDDPRQYILRYLILGAKGAPAEQLIHTLEQYCNIELDEKWLYELAELYAEAGMGELCIMACDKIMLMFGLGKYVEKAMELKIQFAPLTKYQMDLVENRDKYEARLKAVEQEYRAGKRPADYEPMPERKTEVSPQSYMARQEAAFAVEPEAEYPEDGYAQAGHREGGYAEDDYAQTGYQEAGYAEEEYPEDDYSEGDYQKNGYQAEVYQEDTYTDEDDSEEAYGRRGYYGNEYPDQNPQDDTEDGAKAGYPEEHCGNAAGAEKSYENEGAHAQVTIEPEDSEEEEESAEETQSRWMPDKPRILSDEAVRARMHEAEVQANLAKEMSRISDGRYRPETTSAQTRVLTDIKDLGRESSVQESHHFMIEAEYSSSGLDQAIELLKKIHKETGAKNQAAKITGEKLNSKGVFAIADKLTGKNLIIEQAGAMEESTLQELNQLMARDETGMNVVLIDVAGNLARIHKVYPGLAKRFEYVGKMGPEEVAYVAPEGDDRPVRPVQLRKAEEPAVSRKVQSRKEEPAVSKVQPVPEPAAPRSLPKPEPEQKPDTDRKAETEQKPKPVRRKMEESRPEPVARREENKEVPLKAAENPPVLPQPDESDYDDQQEMDIDEFAQYACQYASDIDCSISGKSMLALYERIEIMEEDGVPLTKVNAEDLIEEAADKAENPSFFKRITGIFSSKYDRDGLLILKEEHFI
ncbi:hypothetical protein QMP26_00925 [Enterocloster clostridioformis]|uniref:hypothetical protein n=1 Tax=Enterocloster clostridioformis TaxID=1531 RepID=UPI002676E0EA|nr:hypothetical protein [Enterocloster clostridioformis]